jgi:hypothetical protein
MMETTPIIILTKDNPEYLYITLKSLTATETFNNPIIIVDDCSTLPMSRTFLYTEDVIDVSFDDWTRPATLNTQEIADKEAADSFLNIPKITKILGIKRKFSIIRTPRYLGQEYRTLFGINLGFLLYPNAKTCCIMEDDMLFNKNWLKTAKHIYESELRRSNVGLVSVYNEHAKSTEFPDYLKNDRFQGKMFLITNKFYKLLKKYGYFSSSDFKGHGTTYEILQDIGWNLGFDSFVSIKSYVQNIGKRNLCNKDKILKYDDNFKKPVAWNKDF